MHCSTLNKGVFLESMCSASRTCMCVCVCMSCLQFVNHTSAGHHQDDLLFFVRQQRASAAGGSPQVFVRRKTKQLPDDLQLTGKDFGTVDWVQTVLLNLVLHSEYQLTVVACG